MEVEYKLYGGQDHTSVHCEVILKTPLSIKCLIRNLICRKGDEDSEIHHKDRLATFGKCSKDQANNNMPFNTFLQVGDIET